jgi:hypothetical protein
MLTSLWHFDPNSRVVEIREPEVDIWTSKCPSPAISPSQARADKKYIRIGPASSTITVNPFIDMIYPVFCEPELLQHFVADVRLLALNGYWLLT